MRNSTAKVSDDAYVLDRHLIGKLPAGRILNLGSGLGLAVEGREVVNVDHVLPPRRPETVFVVADACNLPFRNRSFDGALLKDLIEHLDDPISALAETARALRPGGVVTVQTPRAIPRAVWADPTHIRGFTARALRTAMTMAGLVPSKPVRIGGFPLAGRLGLVPWLEHIMRVPGIGHRFGTNWLAHGRPVPARAQCQVPAE